MQPSPSDLAKKSTSDDDYDQQTHNATSPDDGQTLNITLPSSSSAVYKSDAGFLGASAAYRHENLGNLSFGSEQLLQPPSAGGGFSDSQSAPYVPKSSDLKRDENEVEESLGASATYRRAITPQFLLFGSGEPLLRSPDFQKDSQKPEPEKGPSFHGWDANVATLAELPLFFPADLAKLELPREDFPELLGRIQLFLKENSIQASFENVPASAKLQTTDRVELRIKFWAARNPEKLIVDIQRIRGDQIKFGRVLRQLLAVARGDREPEPHQELNIMPVELDLSKIRGLQADAEQMAPFEDAVPSESSAIASIVHMIYQSLTSKSFGDRTTGLEVYVNLTDTGKTMISAARQGALILLQRQVPLADSAEEQEKLVGECEEIQSIIFHILQNGCFQGDEELRKLLDASAGGFFESATTEPTKTGKRKRGQYEEAMMGSTHKVLTALVNSLETISLDQSLEPKSILDDFLLQFKQLTEADVYTPLVKLIDGCDDEMAVAYLACKAMRLLLELSREASFMEQIKADERAVGVVRKAVTTGASCHALLETEAKKLLACIEA